MQPIKTFCTLLYHAKVSSKFQPREMERLLLFYHVFCFRSKGTHESRKETKSSVTYLPHVLKKKTKQKAILK
jgi:hypothetical protein